MQQWANHPMWLFASPDTHPPSETSMSRSLRTIVLSASMLLFTGACAMAADSYGDTVQLKLGSGVSNILLGLVEVPKNIISTSNQANVLLGITGGTVKGTAHALGRTLAGIVDVLSFPVPTKPITNPPFVWQNWYTDTTYGPFFQTGSPAAGVGMGGRY
jgi:putative exosortase-associated protein (TIGR04073 family)